jgi:formyltetrahydrofolate hydrolase
LDAAVVDARRRARIIVMVSRFDHALLHLLYQVRVGWLDADIVAIVSNHPRRPIRGGACRHPVPPLAGDPRHQGRGRSATACAGGGQ